MLNVGYTTACINKITRVIKSQAFGINLLLCPTEYVSSIQVNALTLEYFHVKVSKIIKQLMIFCTHIPFVPNVPEWACHHKITPSLKSQTVKAQLQKYS